MTRAKSLVLAIVVGVIAALALTSSASAQKVGNPGNFNFKLTNGVMKVKDQQFSFDSSQNINFNGTVNGAGAINIPSITFPSYPISASGFNLTVKINVVGPTTGTVNPLTGAVSLVLKVWIKIDGVPLGGGCRIASSSSPITLNALITGTSGSVHGTAYNPSNGTMKIANGTFSVPSSSDCGVAAGTVNDTVGLPSPSGQNTAVFDITTVPAVSRAITPTFSASPTSGTAPVEIDFNAAGTTVSSGPANYQWDFENDGTFDQSGSANTASFTYTSGGTKTVRLRVTDSQGDYAETTRTVNISAYPNLAITAAADSDFTVGSTGTYRINVANQGYANSGTTTVTSTLPAGLTYVSSTGSGWSCSAAGQDLTCTRTTAISPGAAAPELGVNVDAGPDAYPSVDAVFEVATSGDSDISDNSASNTNLVRAVDLKIEHTQVPHALLPGADPANLIELRAHNVGNAPTTGTVTITDVFPAGLTPLSASGTGWTCNVAGQTVTCTRSDSIAADATTDPVSVQVEATLEPGSPGELFQNDASVAVANDINAGNDSIAADVLVLDGPDLGITKSHTGAFTAGKQESYTLSVQNLGPQESSGGATVTDSLPSSLHFVSADGGPEWQCGEQGGTVTCEHSGEIPAGGSAPDITLTVNVGVEAIPSVTNTASVATGVDPNPANDESSDTATVRAIDMVIAKTHDGEIRVGQNETFHLAAENVGDSETIAPTVITDQLPVGLTFVSADGGAFWTCQEAAGTVTCQHDDPIAPGDTVPPVDVVVAVGAAAAPSVINIATVSTPSDFNTINNVATDGGDVIDVDAAIEIGRTGSFGPGQTGTYLLNVKNEGAVAASAPIEVEAELGNGLEFDSAAGDGWTCGEDQGTVSCSGHSGLAAGASAPVIQLRVGVTAGAVPETTTVARVSTTGDRFPDNDEASDSATVLGTDLAVVSQHSGTFRVGGTGSYELTVTNHGSGPNTGPVTVSDQLPAGFSVIRAQGNGWSCDISGPVECVRSDQLAPGASFPPITVEASVTPAALPAGEFEGTALNTATVSTQADIDPANDSSDDVTDIVGADLAVDLSGPTEIGVGGLASFEVSVTGHGAPNGGPIRVELTLPVGFSPRSSEGSGWTCESAGRKFTCLNPVSLTAAETAPTLTLVARVGEGAPANAATQAKVFTTGDVIAANDQASLTTATIARPDLRAELSALTADGSFLVGADGAYRAVFRNVGTAATTGSVDAEITLPSGIRFLGVDQGTGWSCDADGTPIACEHAGPVAAGAALRLGFRVAADQGASSPASTTVAVSTADDLNDENDEASAETAVRSVDLTLSREQIPVWTAGGEGAYEVRVTNRGTAPTIASAVVTETLPQGTEFRLATGDGWSCAVSARRLRCEGPAAIAPGDTSKFQVTLGLPATETTLMATSAVHTVADVDPANDSATETIEVAAAGSTAPVRSARITSSRSRATRSGLVLLWVKCPSGSGAKCHGRVRLKTAGKVRLGKGRKVLALGSSRYAVAPGRRMPVRVRLKKSGATALAKLGRVKARATVTTKGADATRRVLSIRRAGR